MWGGPEDYREHLRLEALEDPVLWECTAMLYQGQMSSYRRRLMDERLIGSYTTLRQTSKFATPFPYYAAASRSSPYHSQRKHALLLTSTRGSQNVSGVISSKASA